VVRDDGAIPGDRITHDRDPDDRAYDDRAYDDRGSATVFAAFASLAVLLVLMTGVDLGGAALARHRAEAAADLAALAAAGRSIDGAGAACDLARGLTERMQATLDHCALDDWDAMVQVRVRRSWSLLAAGDAVARARAGPVPEEPLPGGPASGPANRTSGRQPSPPGRGRDGERYRRGDEWRGAGTDGATAATKMQLTVRSPRWARSSLHTHRSATTSGPGRDGQAYWTCSGVPAPAEAPGSSVRSPDSGGVGAPYGRPPIRRHRNPAAAGRSGPRRARRRRPITQMPAAITPAPSDPA
jgi:secretion/DNA translocation related TadE-like protein